MDFNETNTTEAPSAPQGLNGKAAWVLLIVGLALGAAAGFFIRPVVMPEPAVSADTVASEAAPMDSVAETAEMTAVDPHQAVMVAVTSGARHFIGDPDAPVTIIEFGDFNCGYCARWAEQVLPEIEETYIDSGQVRLGYIHFPFLGPDSMIAAGASECAAAQDEFWAFHDTLYTNIGSGFTEEKLLEFAETLELDMERFETCLSDFSQDSMQNDVRLAQTVGVRGTPAFLINSVPLAGAYPFDQFAEVIDALLAGEDY